MDFSALKPLVDALAEVIRAHHWFGEAMLWAIWLSLSARVCALPIIRVLKGAAK